MRCQAQNGTATSCCRAGQRPVPGPKRKEAARKRRRAAKQVFFSWGRSWFRAQATRAAGDDAQPVAAHCPKVAAITGMASSWASGWRVVFHRGGLFMARGRRNLMCRKSRFLTCKPCGRTFYSFGETVVAVAELLKRRLETVDCQFCLWNATPKRPLAPFSSATSRLLPTEESSATATTVSLNHIVLTKHP